MMARFGENRLVKCSFAHHRIFVNFSLSYRLVETILVNDATLRQRYGPSFIKADGEPGGIVFEQGGMLSLSRDCTHLRAKGPAT